MILADDHVLVRSGLRALVERLPEYEVIAEAADGQELLDACARLAPDLAIVDIQMPGVNGIEALSRLKQQAHPPKVLILSMHSAEDYVLRALRLGADGYLLKDAAEAELEMALAAVQAGERYLSPRVSRAVVENAVRGEDQAPAPLSPRQREVLRLLALGRATKEVAYDLGLSPKTVETHRAQIMDRLGIRDLAGLVRYALRNGLIDASD